MTFAFPGVLSVVLAGSPFTTWQTASIVTGSPAAGRRSTSAMAAVLPSTCSIIRLAILSSSYGGNLSGSRCESNAAQPTNMPRCSPISSSQRARRNLTKFFSLPAQYIQPIQHPLLIERHFFRRGLSSQRLNLVYSFSIIIWDVLNFAGAARAKPTEKFRIFSPHPFHPSRRWPCEGA